PRGRADAGHLGQRQRQPRGRGAAAGAAGAAAGGAARPVEALPAGGRETAALPRGAAAARARAFREVVAALAEVRRRVRVRGAAQGAATDMTFTVSEDCLKLGLRAGAVVFRGVRVGPSGPELRAEIASAVEVIRARYAG